MKVLKIATIGLSLALATACSKEDAKEVVNNIDNQPNLNGSYLSSCSGSEFTDLSVQEKLTFGGNQFTRELSYYQSADCSDEKTGGTLTLKGDFVVDSDGLNQSEAGAIKIEYAEASINAQQDYLVDALNTAGFCGRDDYQKDQKADITSGTDNVLCPVQDVPETIYGAYQLKDDNLYLNEGGFSAMGTSTDDRPENLDKESPYVRQ